MDQLCLFWGKDKSLEIWVIAGLLYTRNHCGYVTYVSKDHNAGFGIKPYNVFCPKAYNSFGNVSLSTASSRQAARSARICETGLFFANKLLFAVYGTTLYFQYILPGHCIYTRIAWRPMSFLELSFRGYSMLVANARQ